MLRFWYKELTYEGYREGGEVGEGHVQLLLVQETHRDSGRYASRYKSRLNLKERLQFPFKWWCTSRALRPECE